MTYDNVNFDQLLGVNILFKLYVLIADNRG